MNGSPDPDLPTGDLVVRAMTRPEVDFAVELANREGWNPGLHDAECFHRADPGGFLVATLGGRPVGCLSAVSYPGGFGFLGFYVVLSEHRGRGYGLRLWEAALRRLGGHVVGLDGVVARQADYARSGFKLAYGNVRFEGRTEGPAPATPDDAVRDLGEVPFDAVCEYDRRCFPADRRTFLEGWLRMPESFGVAWRDGEAIKGYGVVRRCVRGYKIGPLFADDAEIADGLFRALAGRPPGGEPLFLDVPEVNADATALARRYGMSEAFRTARMYLGGRPAIDLDRVFGVTTFELG